MAKIIKINSFHKKLYQFKKNKMLFLSIIIGFIVSILLWKYLVENIATYDVKIPESANITFNDKAPNPLTLMVLPLNLNNMMINQFYFIFIQLGAKFV